MNESTIQKLIIDTIKSSGKKNIRRRELYKLLGSQKPSYNEFKSIIASLEKEGSIVSLKGRRFGVPEQGDSFTGVFTASPNGNGYIRSEQGDSYFVRRYNINGAVTGDTVEAKVLRRRHSEHTPAARILKIIERTSRPVVGIFKKTAKTRYIFLPIILLSY